MKISVIIVSYNTEKLLEDCLSSLFKHTQNVETEVVVVDNASSDGSVKMIKKKFPKVKLIESQENNGFAAGNNLGLKVANGDYLLLLNSDTRFVEDSLFKMVEYMDQNPKVGISSCQLIYEDNDIQPSGGFFPNLWRVFVWMFFLDDLPIISQFVRSFHPHSPKFYTNDNWYKFPHLQDWVTGAFFLMRKEVAKELGPLDENFFMYVEEMEYCYRARKLGWQVSYTPVTKIIHLGGRSSTQKKALVGEYKGLKYFYTKHKSPVDLFFFRIFLKAGAILRILLFGIMKGSKEARETYVEAFRII